MARCSNSDEQKRELTKKKLIRVRRAVSRLGSIIEKKMPDSDVTKNSFLNMVNIEVRVIMDKYRIENSNIMTVFENKRYYKMLTDSLTSMIARKELYFGDESGRTLSQKAVKVYDMLNNTPFFYKQKLETRYNLFRDTKNTDVTEFFNTIGIKDSEGKLTKEGRKLVDFKKEQDDRYLMRVKTLIRYMIEGEKANPAYDTIRSIIQNDSNYKFLSDYLRLEVNHLKELFPREHNDTIELKILSHMIDKKLILRIDENGDKVLKFLHGAERTVLAPKEYIKSKEAFVTKYHSRMPGLSVEDIEEIFDALTGRNLNLRDVGLMKDKTPSTVGKVSVLERIINNNLEYKDTIKQIVYENLKNPLETIEDGTNRIFKEKEMIRLFGREPDEIIDEVSRFITSLGKRGDEKGMKLEHLQEYKKFIQDVFYDNKKAELYDSYALNAAGAIVDKVAIPMMLSGTALKHGFEGLSSITKRAFLTNQFFDKEYAKIVWNTTRNGTSILPKIPLAFLYELPLGKTYKKVINEVAKMIDWSTLKNLNVAEQLHLASNIRIAVEGLGYNISSRGDENLFLGGLSDAVRRIGQVEILDKFNHFTIRNLVEKDIAQILRFYAGEIPNLKRSYLKFIKDSGASERDFKMLLNLENDVKGNKYNEKNKSLAEEELFPKTFAESKEYQKEEIIHNYTIKEIAKVLRAVNSITEETSINKLEEKINKLNRSGKDKDKLELYRKQRQFLIKIKRMIKNMGYESLLDYGDLKFKKKFNEKHLEISFKKDAKIFKHEKIENLSLEMLLERLNDNVKKVYSDMYKDFLKDAKDIFQDPENSDLVIQYFEGKYAEKPHQKAIDIKSIIDRRLENTEMFRSYLHRYYESPLTQVGIRRSMSGLDNKYYSLNDLLIRSKTAFLGVGARAIEQGVQATDAFKANHTDDEGKWHKAEAMKSAAKIATLMVLVSVLKGMLYNVNMMLLGKDEDWSSEAVLKYGLEDDVLYSAYTTLINEYDSYASKLVYSLIHGDLKPFLKVAGNNTLFLDSFLEGNLQIGKF